MFKKSQVDYADIMMFTLAAAMSIPALGLIAAALISIPTIEGMLATIL